MSQTHIRVKRDPPKIDTVPGVVILAIIGFLAVLALGLTIKFFLLPGQQPVYITTEGKIEQTRVAVAYTRATNFGGMIFYQIETLVSYQKNGKTEECWLVASSAVREREILLRRISQNPTKCTVFWPEHNPDNAKCKIQDAWAQYPDLNPRTFSFRAARTRAPAQTS